jgi:hypothetical protein
MFHSPMLSQQNITDPKKIANGSQHTSKFLLTGRRRPDMHNLIPKLKGVLNSLYKFNGSVIGLPSLHLAVAGRVGRSLRRRRALPT